MTDAVSKVVIQSTNCNSVISKPELKEVYFKHIQSLLEVFCVFSMKENMNDWK